MSGITVDCSCDDFLMYLGIRLVGKLLCLSASS